MKSLLRLRNPLTAVKIFELRRFHVRHAVGFQLLYRQNTLTTIMRRFFRGVGAHNNGFAIADRLSERK